MCVLLAEDTYLIAVAAQIELEDAGYEVVTAARVDEAMEMVSRQPGRFTVLVTDFEMPPPHLSGADLIMHMREMYPEIPMLLTSGWEKPLSDEFLAKHRVHALPKPYKPAALVCSVRSLVGAPKNTGRV